MLDRCEEGGEGNVDGRGGKAVGDKEDITRLSFPELLGTKGCSNNIPGFPVEEGLSCELFYAIALWKTCNLALS